MIQVLASVLFPVLLALSLVILLPLVVVSVVLYFVGNLCRRISGGIMDGVFKVGRRAVQFFVNALLWSFGPEVTSVFLFNMGFRPTYNDGRTIIMTGGITVGYGLHKPQEDSDLEWKGSEEEWDDAFGSRNKEAL